MFTELLLTIHEQWGNLAFLGVTGLMSVALCLLIIPKTTGLMVNSAAGLARKYLGPKHRTLVINSSTNNPELFAMLVSFATLRLGGIANPLGSNFANLYLMFLVAPFWCMLGWVMKGQGDKASTLVRLASKEKRLLFWHFAAVGGMFLSAVTAYVMVTGVDPFGLLPGDAAFQGKLRLLGAAAVLIVAIVLFFVFEKRLKKGRPELFSDISSGEEDPSWIKFFAGTFGLIAACFVMNVMFRAWSEVYSGALSAMFGAAVFAALHYFVGSLITSLPELMVASANFARLRAADLNTALGGASYSNMSNLAVAAIGALIAFALFALGFDLIL